MPRRAYAGAVPILATVLSLACSPGSPGGTRHDGALATDPPAADQPVLFDIADVPAPPDAVPVPDTRVIPDLPDTPPVPDAAIAVDVPAPPDVPPALDTAGATDLPDEPDPGPPPMKGSWDDPIVVGPLPWSHAADTSSGWPSQANAYSPCAPGTDESGPEVVYVLVLEAAGNLEVAVNDAPGDSIDVDVHLLSAPDPLSCVARDNISLTAKVGAGTHYIVVDTWVDAAGEPKPGPYVLTVSLVTSTPGPCEGGTSTCTKDDTPLVNGVPWEAAGTGGCPAGMVLVDTFCVDRYEAALVALGPDGSLSGWSPYQNPGSISVMALSAAGLVPQGYITQLQATAACEAAGKRLCSNTEWLRACRGPTKTTYPYGNTVQPGVCNDSRPCHPVVEYFGTSADWIWSELGHPCINQLPDTVAATGANPGCITAEGLFDMMGNLHEWTADPAGTFRGGFYADTKINGPGCLYATTAHNVYHWDYSTGFRCCADL